MGLEIAVEEDDRRRLSLILHVDRFIQAPSLVVLPLSFIFGVHIKLAAGAGVRHWRLDEGGR